MQRTQNLKSYFSRFSSSGPKYTKLLFWAITQELFDQYQIQLWTCQNHYFVQELNNCLVYFKYSFWFYVKNFLPNNFKFVEKYFEELLRVPWIIEEQTGINDVLKRNRVNLNCVQKISLWGFTSLLKSLATFRNQ